MNFRQAKKIYIGRRGRKDSPRIAYESEAWRKTVAGRGVPYGPNCGGPWPWNKQTWNRACNWYWLKRARNGRPEFYTRGMRRQRQLWEAPAPYPMLVGRR